MSENGQIPSSAVTITDRQQRVVSMLATEGFLSVRNLKAHLGVSEMTVRRDLRALAERDLVRLVHGGVALTHGTLRTPGFVNRAGVEANAKQRIAQEARTLVSQGDSIAIDAGTTAFALAERLHDLSPRSVITNSIPVIQLFLGRPDQSVVVLGGDVIAGSQAMVGPLAVAAVENLRATTLFLGAASADARGVYVETDIERPTKLAMMQSADAVVLLCDASKFAVSAPVRLASFADIDILVTDEEPPAEVRRAASRGGMEVRVVGTT